MIENSFILKRRLFTHQIESLKKLQRLECEQKLNNIKTQVGFFSDPQGYGKSATIIALINNDDTQWDQNQMWIQKKINRVYAQGMIKEKEEIILKRLKSTLIVISPSIFKFWIDEVEEMTNLKYHVIKKKKNLDIFQILFADVVFCIPSLYNLLMDLTESYVWKRFIHDEPFVCHVRNMKRIYCRFLWILSSRPKELFQKHFISISTIFNSPVSYEFLEKLMITFDDIPSTISCLTDLPEMDHNVIQCYNPEDHVVKDILKLKINEKIESCNIEQIITKMNGYCTKYPINHIMKIYDSKLESLKKRCNLLINNDEIKKMNDKIHHLECQKQEWNAEFEKNLEKHCTICYGSLSSPIIVTCCYQIYCGKCLLEWLKKKKTCPICRQILCNDMLTFIRNQNDEQEEKIFDYRYKKTKIEFLIDLLYQKQDMKICLYGQNNLTFVLHELQFYKFNLLILKGSVDSRSRKLSKFIDHNNQILVLPSIQNSFGLSLPVVDYLIFLHPVNNETKEIVINIHQTIGRTKPLHIYYLH